MRSTEVKSGHFRKVCLSRGDEGRECENDGEGRRLGSEGFHWFAMIVLLLENDKYSFSNKHTENRRNYNKSEMADLRY